MSESTLEIRQRERLLRLDAHIRFQFELTAKRMTYLAIAESFLFSTFILALASSSNPNVHPIIMRVISMVPWSGMLLATVVLASFIGSISLTRKLRRERFILEGEIPQNALHPDVSHASWKIVLGHLPPVCVSVAFLGAWILIWPSSSKLWPQTPQKLCHSFFLIMRHVQRP